MPLSGQTLSRRAADEQSVSQPGLHASHAGEHALARTHEEKTDRATAPVALVGACQPALRHPAARVAT